jgi:superkiller protein 3
MEPAGAQFREAIRLSPGNLDPNLDPNLPLAHRSLGLVLREAGDLQAAAAELRLAVAQRPQDAEGHHILGTVLLKLNDLAGAIDEFRRAVELDPDLAQARASLAQTLQRAGKKEESQKQLAELERINQGTANIGRAMILVETAEGNIKKGQVATALDELQEAVTLSPDFTEARYQLGVALSHVPDASAKTEAAFRQVLELNPNHAPAHFQLGLLLAGRGDKVQASSEFQKAVELAPGLTEAHRALARLAADSHEWATAVRELQAVVAWNPEDAAAHYDLATALKAHGQVDEAAHELQIARRLKPPRLAPH